MPTLIFEKSFPGHKGIPGHQGGSLPRDGIELINKLRDLFHVPTKIVYVDYLTDEFGSTNNVIGMYNPSTDTISMATALPIKPGTSSLGTVIDPEDAPMIGMLSTASLGPGAVIIHEMTHAFDHVGQTSWKARFSDTPEFKKIYNDYVHNFGMSGKKEDVARGISRYSLTKPSECFAEAMVAYVTNPTWLQQAQPKMYAYMDNLPYSDVTESKEIQYTFCELAKADGTYEWVALPAPTTSPERPDKDKSGPSTNMRTVRRVGILKSFPGHLGRPGVRGGSLPRGSLPADPTSHEYSGLKLFEQLNLDNPYHIPVYVRASQLPPVKEGYERVYHGTQNYHAQNIMRYGLMPGKYSGFGERLPAFMATTKGISTFGDINFVVDLPKADVHHVNEDWVEVGKIIEPKDITAIIPAGMSTQDIVGLLKIYDDYKAIYGNKFEKEQHTGAMVAFDMSDDAFGKNLDAAHVTLVYLGEADQLMAEPLYEVLAKFAAEHAPLSGTFTGFAMFPSPADSEDGSAVVVLYDSPDLPAFRQALLHAIANVVPSVLEQDHGFTAHMTLTYTKDPNVSFPTDYVPVPKTFDKITLYWGDKKTDYSLAGTVVEKSFPGHKGVPGQHGGSAPRGYINVKFYNPSYPLEPFGYRKSTTEERKKFVEAINTLPPMVKQLYHRTSPLIFVIKPDEKYFGKHQSNWIIVGEDCIGGISNHEFVHHIVSQYTEQLTAYKPTASFNHALQNTDFYGKLNEDLTMMLDEYHDDDEAWATAIQRVDAVNHNIQLMSMDIAREKVKDVRRFLDYIKNHTG
jgi:2'-5' RNA ligase